MTCTTTRMDKRSSHTATLVMLAVILCCAPPSSIAAAPSVESTSVPKHVQLAYRPENPVPLLELPGHFWTVQLLALSSKSALETYAREHNLQDMSAARIAHDGVLHYALLLGVYETRALAEEAIRDIPQPFDQLEAWIRSVSSLQSAMVAANRLTGSEDF